MCISHFFFTIILFLNKGFKSFFLKKVNCADFRTCCLLKTVLTFHQLFQLCSLFSPAVLPTELSNKPTSSWSLRSEPPELFALSVYTRLRAGVCGQHARQLLLVSADAELDGQHRDQRVPAVVAGVVFGNGLVHSLHLLHKRDRNHRQGTHCFHIISFYYELCFCKRRSIILFCFSCHCGV